MQTHNPNAPKDWRLLLMTCFLLGMSYPYLHAQEWVIKANQEVGQLIRHRPGSMPFDLSRLAQRHAIELIPPSTPSYWRMNYHHPQTGLGVAHQTYGNREVIGRAFLVYSFIQFPLIQRPQLRTWLKFELGLAWNTRIHDAKTLPENRAISFPLNVHAGPGLQVDIPLNDLLDFTTSASFSHQSNANLHQPNLGLNSWLVGAGLMYHVGGRTVVPPIGETRSPTTLQLKKIRWIAQASLIMRESEVAPTLKYWPGLSLMAAFNLRDKGSLWAGTQVLFNSPEPNSFFQPNEQVVMLVGYEWLLGKVGFVGQLLWQVGNLPIEQQLGTIRIGPHLYLNSPFSARKGRWQIGCYITVRGAIAQYTSVALGYQW